MLPSLYIFSKRSIPWKAVAMAASFGPTHRETHWSPSQVISCVFLCLKSAYHVFTFSGLQSHHCEGSEKSHTKLSLSCLLLLLVSLSTLRSCCKSLCVLSAATQGWVNGTLSPPQRIDEATRLRDLEFAGCQTMALWPKWGGLHDRYSKTFLLTMVHSLQSHMSLPHSVNYSIVHNTQSHKLYW